MTHDTKLNHVEGDSSLPSRVLQAGAMGIILTTLVFRVLLSETFERSLPDWIEQLAPAGPGPATTILLGAAIQLAILLWLVARIVDRRLAYRVTGMELGWLLCAAAAAMSCSVAGNTRLAITTASDLLLQIAAGMLLVQLLRSDWHVRILLAVILAGAGVVAVKCLSQHFIEFRQTREFYDLVASQYITDTADPAYRTMLEARMNAAEASGYFSHSNVAGEYLAMVMFVGLAGAWARWRQPGGSAKFTAIAFWGVAGLCLIGLVLTGSRGAQLAAVGAPIGLMLIGWVLRRVRRQRDKRLCVAMPIRIALVGLVLTGAIAFVASGRMRQQLHDSMAFRVQYWQAGWAMARDHGWTGVGPGNFGRRYTQVKLANAPEEVQNPHNLLVQLATEWGWLGLIGLVVAIVGATRRIWPVGRNVSPPPTRPCIGCGLAALCAVAVLIAMGRTLLMWGQSAAFIWIEGVWPVAIWLIWAGVLYTALEAGHPETFDHWLSGHVARLTAALLVFLVGNLAGFSFFVPGAGQTFWAIAALAICVSRRRTDVTPVPISCGRRVAGLIAAVLVLTVFWVTLGYQPLVVAGLGRAASAQADTGKQLAMRRLAVLVDPLDPSPARDVADWLIRCQHAPLRPAEMAQELITQLETAAERDPWQASLRYRVAQAHQLRHRLNGDPNDLTTACDWMAQAVELYPTYPRGRAMYGRLLAETGAAKGSASLREQGVTQLRKALELDSLYPLYEVRRFTSDERRSIESLIQDVGQSSGS